jgi:hypothetical protein
MSLAAADTDAWPEISAENMFNDAPEPGWSFVTVPVTYTNIGTTAEQPWWETDVDFVGSNGVVYDNGSGDQYCGVVPDQAMDIDDMYPGATATGNECVVVPTAYVAGGLWRVRGSYSATPVFVRIG